VSRFLLTAAIAGIAAVALLAVPAPVACAAPLQSEESQTHQHHAAPAEKLGTVDFPVSCSAAARPKFQRAVALLHSFAYEDSEKAFQDVLATDPSCAMAHWGIAMTLFHPVWAAANPTAAPSPAELARGLAEVQKARTPGPPTARERDYVAAVAAFYTDADRLDHPTRMLAFAGAMDQVRARNPKDTEAQIFYALALLGTASLTDKTYAAQKQAAEVLNPILPSAPDHPGIAHYVIHSFDYPPLAELALPAARAYARIAPSAPHALHMPSHIFTRLGLWDESIEANLASAEAARRTVARNHPGATAFDELHALDYLEYAYLQAGRDAEATGVVEKVRKVDTLDAQNFAAAYALAAVPARHALERRDWAEAATVTLGPASFPWARFPHTEAIGEFARAVGAARQGDLPGARAAVGRLQQLHDTLVERKDAYWAGQVDILHDEAAATLADAEGRRDEAVRLLRAAALREDASEKSPVTPGSILPAREMLADLLLDKGDAAGALTEYQAVLRVAPGRYRSLAGAARAAEASGDLTNARVYNERLVEQCGRADPSRVEVGKARAALVAPVAQ
jgi:tetratricopeptide (TPR) repeat protein